MKTYKAKAKEWLNDFTGDKVSSDEFCGAYEFAKWLDQEAQEKSLYTAGLAGEISNCQAQNKPNPDRPSITYTKPQQPEEIGELEYDGTLDDPMPIASYESLIKVVKKLNEVIKALNRLTHKD